MLGINIPWVFADLQCVHSKCKKPFAIENLLTLSGSSIDVTHRYAPDMFRDVTTRLGAKDTEEVLRSGHWQSYNIWRPIKTVKRDALAVLDTASASREQLVSASFDRGDGHIVSMDWLMSGIDKHQPDDAIKHKWYYLNEQEPNEVVAFKIYDSDLDSSSNGTPHTAIHIPGMWRLAVNSLALMKLY
jgi:hypothetical protein